MLGYPDASLVKSILAKRCVRTTHGRTLRYIKYEPGTKCEPSKSKWLAKGNLGAMPHKSNSNYHKGETQRLCLSPSPLMCPSTRIVIFSSTKYFISFSTICLCGNSFLQSQRPGSLSLTTSLVARIWCFQPSPASGWEPKPCSKLLQGRPHKIISSILAWKIPWTEKPGGIQSLGSKRVMSQIRLSN